MTDILPSEYLPISGQIDTLSTMYRENYIGGPLRVDARSVGVSLWESLINQTQGDNIERGIVVSTKGDDLLMSKIYKGAGKEEIFDGLEMRTRAGSFTPPLLPHGIHSLNPSIVDITVVHSHAMPTSLAHLPTTILSDKDILNFINSKYHALCAVDRGGAHLLVRTHRSSDNKTPDPRLVRDIIAETVKQSGGIRDAIIEVSKNLQHFGLAYLFTPQLEEDSDGVMTFQEAK